MGEKPSEYCTFLLLQRSRVFDFPACALGHRFKSGRFPVDPLHSNPVLAHYSRTEEAGMH